MDDTNKKMGVYGGSPRMPAADPGDISVIKGLDNSIWTNFHFYSIPNARIVSMPRARWRIRKRNRHILALNGHVSGTCDRLTLAALSFRRKE